jgi:hypothetical protein
LASLWVQIPSGTGRGGPWMVRVGQEWGAGPKEQGRELGAGSLDGREGHLDEGPQTGLVWLI